MKKTCIFGLLLALALLLPAQAALAQAPAERGPGRGAPPGPAPGIIFAPQSSHPRLCINVFPLIAGVALDTDEVDPHAGLGLGFCYNFLRRGSFSWGTEFNAALGLPFDSGPGTSEGHWIHTSLGFPLRIGGSMSFVFRPGLTFDVLDHYQHGIDDSGYVWERDFDSSVGFGLILSIGFDINLARRFAIGFLFNFEFLPVSHDCQRIYDGSDDGTENGYITIWGAFRFLIRI